MLSILHTVDAVSSMRALQAVLAGELEHIEEYIQELHEVGTTDTNQASETDDKLGTCLKARAAIYSCMASITDVLGWVHLMAEKDAQGNDNLVVQSLPSVPVLSIN